MSSFFVLDTTEASDKRLFAGGQWMNDERERCGECGSFGPISTGGTIEIALNHSGRQGFAECLWHSHSLPLFRGDLVDTWLNADLSGFDRLPVRVSGWYQKPKRVLPDNIPAYWLIRSDSFVKLGLQKAQQGECASCGVAAYDLPEILPRGLPIEADTWDHSDFFSAKGYNFLFVSRRTVEVTLRRGRASHFSFIATEKWGTWEPFDVAKWTSKGYAEYMKGFMIRELAQLV